MILIGLAILAANPSNFNSVLAAAQPGDTVRLVAASYPPAVIKGRTFSPPLTIDASAATLPGVAIFNSTGVRWTGGTVTADPASQPAIPTGIFVQLSGAITISGVHVSRFFNGIIYDRVSGGEISGNWLAGMASDGIDLALSRRVVVANNACSDFHPADGAHPDCIQLWSRPTAPPVADVVISGNTAVGAMQGITMFNHVRGGVDDGGYDRITIANNNVLNTYADGIAVYDCRGCAIRYNTVGSLPNYINVAQLYVSGGSVSICGNAVVKVPRQAGPACAN